MELFLCSPEAEWNYDVFSILLHLPATSPTENQVYNIYQYVPHKAVAEVSKIGKL